ncbi:MAG: S41 family peptidase [Clostridia bacterium]
MHRVLSFDDETADDFKAKYEELQKQGIKSLVIDLRNNGGGIVDEALQIADYILNKDDVILYEVDKNNKEEIRKG